MIEFPYTDYQRFPAPFVEVAIRDPGTGMWVGELPGQLDSAADRSVVPEYLARQLDLVSIGTFRVQGFDGHISHVPTYLVDLAIKNMPVIRLRVMGSGAEPHVLIGRDAMNQLVILLDGPKLKVTLAAPESSLPAE